MKTKRNKRNKKAKPKLVEKSRKEKRKEQRKQKKAARAAYFQKKPDQSVKDTSLQETTVRPKKAAVKEVEKKHVKEQKTRQLERGKEKQRKRLMEEANLKEDRIIKKLEKQLKLNKKRKNAIPKSFVADGLDYLLDFCVEENRENIVQMERQLLENEADTKFKKDLTMITGDDEDDEYAGDDSIVDGDVAIADGDDPIADGDDSIADSDESIADSDDDNENSVDFQSEAELANNDDPDDSSETEEQEMLNTADIESDDDLSGDDQSRITKTNRTENIKTNSDDEGLWEDIYGRQRDKQGNIVHATNKYVPPAVRAAVSATSTDEKQRALRRQLKGCLNRVAEHNIHSIANQIDELYMANSRNDMNDILSKLIIEALVAPVLTPDRMICEHMMLIAILHANVGVEVGAHFLMIFVKKFDEMLKELQDVENKELDNLILMISHLYNFKLYGHGLLYQLLEKLSTKFTEKEIELILLVLKTVGFRLRKDDPVALKEFIQKLQQKASCEKENSTRVKFMLDVLLAIKNNNMSKIPGYDVSCVERLKKVMKTVVRKGNVMTEFNVSLEDLLHVEERGKWWVVGSAWTGANNANSQSVAKDGNKIVFGQKLLELARKQRMNTDTRRNIFCVLMTAEDYLDAFEKLHHLGLKDHQDREVVHVLIHCCLQENKFNPYYAVLAQKLCEYNRKYQLAVQYALWDKLKTLENYTVKQISNLARFLIHLFVEQNLAFSVMKVIQFAELNKHTVRLLRQIILGILLHQNEESCLKVFERISVSPQLQSFRESLRLFISHFLVKNIDTSSALDEKEATLTKRAELVDKILIARGTRVIF